MSYCRFSSDFGLSDVYAYESIYGGYTVHVAKFHRDVPKEKYEHINLPERDAPKEEWDKYAENYIAFIHRDRSDEEYYEIDSEYAGKTFYKSSLKELLDLLLEIKKAGLHVPKDCIEAICEELYDEL